MGSKRSNTEHGAPKKRPPSGAKARTLVEGATGPLASTRTGLERTLGEHERAEEKVAVANAELRRRNAEGDRLEDERRAAERGLHEVHARFESAFANAPIGMALVDMEGRWLQVNDALCRITGHTRADLKATTLRALTHPEDVDLDADSLRELREGRISSYQTEKRYRHAWGHYLWGNQAQIAADGIVKTMGRHVAVLGDQSIRVTASVGLAMFDGLSAAEVLACADLAMYEAKHAGRNRFALYTPGQGRRERVSAHLAEAEHLRTALEEDRLLLYGQPILDLRENEVCQYEVLLRLRDEAGGEPLTPVGFSTSPSASA